MWICLNDGFLSIVRKDCKADELLVRARRKGDIEKLFPEATVTVVMHADYRYRAVVPVEGVIAAISCEIENIDYPNFKNSVRDEKLHTAYARVWGTMMYLQKP